MKIWSEEEKIGVAHHMVGDFGELFSIRWRDPLVEIEESQPGFIPPPHRQYGGEYLDLREFSQEELVKLQEKLLEEGLIIGHFDEVAMVQDWQPGPRLPELPKLSS